MVRFGCMTFVLIFLAACSRPVDPPPDYWDAISRQVKERVR